MVSKYAPIHFFKGPKKHKFSDMDDMIELVGEFFRPSAPKRKRGA